METQMIIRIKPELKTQVSHLARAEGKTSSEVVRELLAEYVQSHDRGGYISGLWDRIGNTLKEKGVDDQAIRKAIRDSRRAK